MALTLTTDERTELERRTRSRKGRAEDARRARVILMLADGASYAAITTAVDCYPAYVVRWKQRFEAARLAGLEARYRGQPARVRTPAMEARDPRQDAAGAAGRQYALEYAEAGQGARRQPCAGRPRVAARRAPTASAGALHAVGRSRVRAEGGRRHRAVSQSRRSTPSCLRPTRRRRFKRWIAWTRSCRCRRDARNAMGSSTTDTGPCRLYAALNTRTGEILGQTVPRHTSQAFVDFLARHRGDSTASPRDSRHRRQPVGAQDEGRRRRFLETHPRVHLHFTPTYSSWLNQVELWFGKIERDLLARGIFTSLPDLARKIRATSRATTQNPKPIRWTYNDPTHRITTHSADTVH